MPPRRRRQTLTLNDAGDSGAGEGGLPDSPATSDSEFVLSHSDPGASDPSDGVDSPAAPDEAALKPPLPRRRRRGARRSSSDPPLPWQIWEKENEKWVDGVVANGSKASGGAAPAELTEPAPEVVLPLLRFQKEWLAWGLKQESSEDFRGGILSDEMGMGKTIQAISLVLTARHLRPDPPLPQLPSTSTSTSMALPRVSCTLVICPVVAVIQWAGEIERHVTPGKVRVLVYHGPKRVSSGYDFAHYDFVLTTYSTIEADYRRNVMPPKEKCKFCGKAFRPDKMRIHLKYYCGPDAKKTAKQAKQETRKSAKLSSKSKGKQISAMVGDDENLPEKEGSMKRKRGAKKSKEDEPQERGTTRGKSLLHSVKWKRIILDEAHYVKDRHSNTARAVFALESDYKWALSGTPLQNRVGELYSLVRFLRITPYSFYFCKDCDCQVFDTNLPKYCDCSHASTRHFCWWNKFITGPIQNGPDARNRAMILLKEKILKSIILRRTKKERAADLAIPPRIVTLRRDMLDKNEMEFYEALYTQSRIQFDSYVTAGTLMNNYAHIFDLLTRLRQAVDHPYLVVYSKTAPAECPSGFNEVRDNTEQICGLCHHSAEDAVVTSCDHMFCKACLIEYSSSLGNVSCPYCSKPLTVDFTTKHAGSKPTSSTKGFKASGILSRISNIAEFKTSTKIDALKEEIRNMVENDCSAKGIVFSQFTSFLELISYSLQQSGIKFVHLVGSMTLAEREKAINCFTNDPDCRIFLMSLKAGGVALNLTVASYVFLMDPWWNPAVEKQAQDRIHRIGQFKPIRSVRFLIKETIEERILRLQEKKELVFQGTVGDSAEAMAKLTEADLKFLFHT